MPDCRQCTATQFFLYICFSFPYFIPHFSRGHLPLLGIPCKVGPLLLFMIDLSSFVIWLVIWISNHLFGWNNWVHAERDIRGDRISQFVYVLNSIEKNIPACAFKTCLEAWDTVLKPTFHSCLHWLEALEGRFVHRYKKHTDMVWSAKGRHRQRFIITIIE